MLTRILCLVVIIATILRPNSNAQTTLHLDWLFSDEGRAVGSVPAHVWLADGRLMIYDARLPLRNVRLR